MKELKKKERGITLIALIITVIIMLILAGVAISALTKDGGLFSKTQSAVEKYNNAVKEQDEKIASLMNEMDSYFNKYSNGGSTGDEEETKEPEPIVVKLADGMVPVVYNSADTSWYVATEEQIANKTWYNYVDTSVSGQESSSQWANIMLRDNLQVEGVANASIATLADMYGKKVTSEGSMYVYIPRYAYQITSNLHNGGEGVVGDIDIVFIDTNNKNGDKTYSTTYPSTTNSGTAAGKMDDFVVHPAFTWAKEDGTPVALEGIWVGKFEASSANASYAATEAGNVTTSNDVILRTVGNVNSWKNINLNNIFLNCYNMNSTANASIYGISTNKDVIDPHLIKNTEWGAVAYLAHSKYGKNKIIDETMSNTTGYNTGNGNYKANVALSTTGNVYGTYDMAGGAWEQTAAYVDSTKNGTVLNESLTSVDTGKALYDADVKYKDVYTVGSTDECISNYNANISKYGDAIYEISFSSGYWDDQNGINVGYSYSSWNQDTSNFPYSSVSGFLRGGWYRGSIELGIFAFSTSNNRVSEVYSFRSCLTIP